MWRKSCGEETEKSHLSERNWCLQGRGKVILQGKGIHVLGRALHILQPCQPYLEAVFPFLESVTRNVKSNAWYTKALWNVISAFCKDQPNKLGHEQKQNIAGSEKQPQKLYFQLPHLFFTQDKVPVTAVLPGSVKHQITRKWFQSTDIIHRSKILCGEESQRKWSTSGAEAAGISVHPAACWCEPSCYEQTSGLLLHILNSKETMKGNKIFHFQEGNELRNFLYFCKKAESQALLP